MVEPFARKTFCSHTPPTPTPVNESHPSMPSLTRVSGDALEWLGRVRNNSCIRDVGWVLCKILFDRFLGNKVVCVGKGEKVVCLVGTVLG